MIIIQFENVVTVSKADFYEAYDKNITFRNRLQGVSKEVRFYVFIYFLK